MPQDILYMEERKQKILNFIQLNERCSVNELARLFNLTPATIRNDLRELEKTQEIIRTHGGAVLNKKTTHEDFISERKNEDKKNTIALRAIDFMKDGTSIVIDTGTTANAFAQALFHSNLKNIKVLTSDFAILKLLEEKSDYELISLGGTVRNGFHFACGELTLQILDTFYVDKAIITTSAIDIQHGLTTPNTQTAQLKAKMLSRAKELYLLVDSTKFNQTSFSKFADISQFDCIIVDNGIDENTLMELRSRANDVIVA